MKRILAGAMFLGMAGAVTTAHALKITGSAPQMTIKATVNPTIRAAIEGQMNTMLAETMTSTIADANENLKGFKQQKDLAQGFGNANAYSMNSATLQGFQNYDLFAVSSGFMLGLQAPSMSTSYYKTIGDDIVEKGDLYAGIGVGITYLNVGINAGFLMPGLYLNAKYGGMEQDFGDFSFKFAVMGVGANFRLLEPKSALGIIKWRGLSIGSGFYYQGNEINMLVKGETIENEIPFREQIVGTAAPSEQAAYGSAMDQIGFTAATPSATLGLTPKFNMGLDITTMTLPLDATTAVSLLWGLVNITAGAGFDLNFGSSEIILKGLADAQTSSPDSNKVEFSDANVTIDGSSDNGPSFARMRLMTGIGLGLGPVKLDIPFIYYVSSGMAVGVTAAVVW